jgi:hypothetical protein
MPIQHRHNVLKGVAFLKLWTNLGLHNNTAFSSLCCNIIMLVGHAHSKAAGCWSVTYVPYECRSLGHTYSKAAGCWSVTCPTSVGLCLETKCFTGRLASCHRRGIDVRCQPAFAFVTRSCRLPGKHNMYRTGPKQFVRLNVCTAKVVRALEYYIYWQTFTAHTSTTHIGKMYFSLHRVIYFRANYHVTLLVIS